MHDASLHSRFPIFSAYRSFWRVISENLVLLMLVLVVVDWISEKTVDDTWNATSSYVREKLDLDLAKFFEDHTWTAFISEFSGSFVKSIATFAFFQVIAGRFLHGAMKENARISIEQIVLWIRKLDPIIDLYRALIIVLICGICILVFFALMFSITFYVFPLFGFGDNPSTLEMYMSFSIALTAYLAFSYFILRLFFLALPATVIDRTKVLESIERSWKMTATSWFRISILLALIGITYAIACAILVLCVAAFSMAFFQEVYCGSLGIVLQSKSFFYINDLAKTGVMAISMSVCYFHLVHADRNSELGPDHA